MTNAAYLHTFTAEENAGRVLADKLDHLFKETTPPPTHKKLSLIMLRVAKYVAESVLEDPIAISGIIYAIELVKRGRYKETRYIATEKSSCLLADNIQGQAARNLLACVMHYISADDPSATGTTQYELISQGLGMLFSFSPEINWEEKLLKHVNKTLSFND